MPALQVKDCPLEVYERLRACAASENRSISQQALTIIEQFLDMWESLRSIAPTSAVASSYYIEGSNGGDYARKHKEAFERIKKLRPIPHDDTCPSTVEILAQIRKEEAR